MRGPPPQEGGIRVEARCQSCGTASETTTHVGVTGMQNCIEEQGPLLFAIVRMDRGQFK